jgi:hypothetical protein
MDIFTEPSDVDPDTLANLGPLRGLAGTWRGVIGGDVAPKAAGAESSVYVETQRLDPIDPQTNGPQLLYGLRYHIHINKVGEDITFHDQVGYWLWEPATGLVMQTLAIPRGQSLLARGQAKAQDRSFFVTARAGASDYGICSTAFLEKQFRTLSYRIDVTCEDDAFSYVTTTDMMVGGAAKAFDHSDRNRLTRIAPPQPNPLFTTLQARKAKAGA